MCRKKYSIFSFKLLTLLCNLHKCFVNLFLALNARKIYSKNKPMQLELPECVEHMCECKHGKIDFQKRLTKSYF